MVEEISPQKPSRPLPEPNPVTRRAHQRQSFWQITVPFGVAFLLILLLAGGTIWSAATGLGEVSRWADISLIWLVSPQFVLLLIPLVFLSGMVLLITKLLTLLPRYTRLVQDWMLTVHHVVRMYSDKVVEPVLRFRGFKASVEELQNQISRRFKG